MFSILCGVYEVVWMCVGEKKVCDASINPCFLSQLKWKRKTEKKSSWAFQLSQAGKKMREDNPSVHAFDVICMQ